MAKVFREIIELSKAVPGGQTLGALADGRKVFVWGGLPDETVEVEVYKVKKSYAEGRVTQVIRPSSKRVEPRDECYLATSPWQVYDFAHENQLKRELVVEAFAQEKIELKPEATVTDGKEYGYRNKMEYSLWYDHDTQKISLSFHARGSHQKFPVANSSIEREEIITEAKRIVDELNETGAEARQYQSLVVRCNQQGKVSSALFENHKPRPVMQNLTDKILDREFTYSPNGFFQINLPIYEMALATMKKFVIPELPLVDFYSGVGSIGLTLSDAPVLVESNKFASEEAENNAQNLGLANAQVICASAEQALEYITSNINLVVDPPRAGLDSLVVERILESLPTRVIYLSCNPTTQARDIAKLLTSYKTIHAEPYNFFPHTPHIENLVVLELV
jgi:23S rRNA (uracil1939-C5)-methyltransferase